MTSAQVIIARLEQRDLRELAEMVARQYRVLLHDMCSLSRQSGASSARQAFWALLRAREEHWSFSRIGELFDRDHTTIIAGIESHERRTLVKTTGRAGLLRIGQACVDWFIDTGDCHMCQVHGRRHDDDCPVGMFLGSQPTTQESEVE